MDCTSQHPAAQPLTVCNFANAAHGRRGVYGPKQDMSIERLSHHQRTRTGTVSEAAADIRTEITRVLEAMPGGNQTSCLAQREGLSPHGWMPYASTTPKR